MGGIRGARNEGDGCPFCAIVADPGRARVVYEDDGTLAFFPLTPATRGHTLVVPKEHAPDLWAMDDTAAGRLMGSVLTVGRLLREALAPEGMNIVNSAGAVASQSVFHVHVHLVPRGPGDAMGRIWPSVGGPARRAIRGHHRTGPHDPRRSHRPARCLRDHVPGRHPRLPSLSWLLTCERNQSHKPIVSMSMLP